MYKKSTKCVCQHPHTPCTPTKTHQRAAHPPPHCGATLTQRVCIICINATPCGAHADHTAPEKCKKNRQKSTPEALTHAVYPDQNTQARRTATATYPHTLTHDSHTSLNTSSLAPTQNCSTTRSLSTTMITPAGHLVLVLVREVRPAPQFRVTATPHHSPLLVHSPHRLTRANATHTRLTSVPFSAQLFARSTSNMHMCILLYALQCPPAHTPPLRPPHCCMPYSATCTCPARPHATAASTPLAVCQFTSTSS